jgi:hypothetical protein
MGYFVESIHVKLANKRAEILVFEPTPQDFSSEALVVENFISSQLRPSRILMWHTPKKVSPASDHRIKSTLLGSFTILNLYVSGHSGSFDSTTYSNSFCRNAGTIGREDLEAWVTGVLCLDRAI